MNFGLGDIGWIGRIGENPAFAWESDLFVTGSPCSQWDSKAGKVSLTQGTAGARPTVTAAAFGSTQGLTFDGTDDNLQNASQVIARTGSGSLSVVFKTAATFTGPIVLASQADSAAADNWWEFGIAASGKLYVESNANGTKHTVEGSTVLDASTVYNAILTYDGTDFYLLLNGIEENPLVITNVGLFSWMGRVSGGTPIFAIGCTVPSGGAARFFKGIIGGVYFWSLDLTA